MAYGREFRGIEARSLWFTEPRHAELISEMVPEPRRGEVTVRALVSLVSAGTELLVYRGELPPDEDLGVETCKGSFGFPVKYGYQVVGEVIAAGEDAGFGSGQIVFARHPHQEMFTMRSSEWLVRSVPAGLPPERAVFVNLLEVALNGVLDVPVRFGDVVVVYGYGVVGSFCAQLSRRNAGKVLVVDPIAQRRDAALVCGADGAASPEEAPEMIAEMSSGRGADLCIEASGAPAALQAAIRATGQEGTIVEISFFGTRLVPLLLSPEFHYRRQRIISSQVGSIGSGLQPRWDVGRRNLTAFRLLEADWLVAPVSHRIRFEDGADAYRMLDEGASDAMGVVLVYGDGAQDLGD